MPQMSPLSWIMAFWGVVMFILLLISNISCNIYAPPLASRNIPCSMDWPW